MGYNDFWFVETRNQSNNLKRWFLWGILLFAFVTIATTFAVKSMYFTMRNYQIQADMPIVTVQEAKKTNANGYIKGTVQNNIDTDITGKYIKFAFFTKNDVNVGNEYIEIGTLKPTETKAYELKFRYSNVEKFIITITENKEE